MMRSLLFAVRAVGMIGAASFAAPVNAAAWADHPENVWVRQSPRDDAPAPGFLYEGSGGFDPDAGQWMHHAGHDGIPQGFHTFTCDLETGRWTQRFPPTSPPGVCCVDGGGVFDLARRRLVRFPGGCLGHGYQWSRGVRLKDSAVWLYDPAMDRWINMRPPPYQEPEKYSREVLGGLCSGATYAANHELVISFGGTGAGGAKNALFVYDPHANALHLRKPANAPSARDGMGLAYDTAHDKLVMFGSQYLSDEKTWLYDFRENAWQAHDISPHPPARKTGSYSSIPRLAYDSVNGVVLGLVWLDDQGHETWVFETGKLTWRKLNPATEPAPSKSRSRNLAFSARHNLFILETSSRQNRPELWTYRYRPADPTPRPSPPTDVQAETDADQVILRWTASPSRTVKEYRVQRAEPEEPWLADFKTVGTTAATVFEDRGVTPGRAYHYIVKAVMPDGQESQPSWRARTQPQVPDQPVVSVLATNRVHVRWNSHPARDIVGHNLYRGLVTVKTVRKGEPGAWRDNDPEYSEPRVAKVTDLTGLRRLNDHPLRATTFTDQVDLTRKGLEAADYEYAVHAYVVRAVNKLGVESGPSPYALTIPSEPVNLLCRERGDVAELKWDANTEQAIAGYRVYTLKGTWEIVPLTPEPLRQTTFSWKTGRNATRFWVTAVDALGQEGQPSSPAWCHHAYPGFYEGEWHQ